MKVLYIKANPKANKESASSSVADKFIESYKRENPSDIIDTVDLYKENWPHLGVKDLDDYKNENGSLKTISNQNSLSIYVQLNIIYNENMAGEEGQYSKWRFEYKLLGNGDSYSGYTILYKDIYYEEQNSGTYFVHGYNNDGFILNNIDLSVGKTLMCMLTRIGTADTYADKVYLSGINFAIPIDSIGSDFTNSKIVI